EHVALAGIVDAVAVRADAVARAVDQENAAVAIAQGVVPSRVHADEVPGHDVVDRGVEGDAVIVDVAGNDVPLGGVADAVAIGAYQLIAAAAHVDAAEAVGQPDRPIDVGPEVITGHGGRGDEVQQDAAIAAVGRDNVAFADIVSLRAARADAIVARVAVQE